MSRTVYYPGCMLVLKQLETGRILGGGNMPLPALIETLPLRFCPGAYSEGT